MVEARGRWDSRKSINFISTTVSICPHILLAPRDFQTFRHPWNDNVQYWTVLAKESKTNYSCLLLLFFYDQYQYSLLSTPQCHILFDGALQFKHTKHLHININIHTSEQKYSFVKERLIKGVMLCNNSSWRHICILYTLHKKSTQGTIIYHKMCCIKCQVYSWKYT